MEEERHMPKDKGMNPGTMLSHDLKLHAALHM